MVALRRLKKGQPAPGPSPVAAALKSLREDYGVSMRELAEAIGKRGASSWQHYEARFKGSLLPLAIAQQIAPLFESRGCPVEKVLKLAGVSEAAPVTQQPGPESSRSLREEVADLERMLDEAERRLTALRNRLR